MSSARSPFSLLAPLALWIVASIGPASVLADTSRRSLVIAGRVDDPTGRPVGGARIMIEEIGRTATTDEEGRFQIKDLGPGLYTISISRSGYAPAVRSLSPGQPQELAIVLKPTPFELEPINVTGARVPMDPTSSPLPASTLSGDALRRDHSVSLAHAIEGLPGVRTLSTGAEIGKPVIRGFEGSRVLVLDNGHRLEDYSWSDEDGPSVDAREAERVEVIRGPASVLYGSDALGGVVNAVSEQLPDALDRDPFHRIGGEAYGASNNAEVGSALRLEGARKGLGYRILGVGRHGSNLHTPAGELDNTGFFAVNGEGAVGVRGSRGGAALRLARYGGEFHLLEAGGPPPDSSNAGGGDEGPVRKSNDIRLQFDSNYLLGGMRFELKSQWQRHSLAEVSDEAIPPPTAPGKKTETTAFDLLLNTVSVDLLAQHGHGPWQGTLGISGLHQGNDTRGPIPLVPDATTSAEAVYGLERASLGRWSLLVGARVDHRHLTAEANPDLHLADQSRNYTEASADGGVIYRASDGLSVTGNIGRGWRAPNLFELFAYGPHVGEARFEIGDSSLVPERSLSLDASVRWRDSRVRGEVSAFRSEVENYIFIAPTDEEIDGLGVSRYEQAKAVLLGGEAAVEIEVARPLLVTGAVDYVRGDNKDLDRPLPLMPPLRGTMEAELHGAPFRWAGESHLGMEVETFAKQTRLGPFDVQTNGYTLVNVDSGLERDMGGRMWRFDLAVRNLANVKYKSFLSRYKEFAYDPGANVILRVSAGI